MRFIMGSTLGNNLNLFTLGAETESEVVNARLARRCLVRHTSRRREHDNQYTLMEALQWPWQSSTLRTRRLLQSSTGLYHAYGNR